MNKIQASIVIPVFNRAHLVPRAIDSALAQTVPCEVLLVDHGSTDDIAAVASHYGDHIRYIRRDVDHGPIASWKDGAEQATGEYLHFTYDDDWIQPRFIEECLNHMDSSIGFVYTRATIHDQAMKSRSLHLRHPAGVRPMYQIVQYLLHSPLTISPGCALFRRSDVLKNLLTEIPDADGIYGKSSGVGEDLLLFLLTSLSYTKYAHIPQQLADFLSHPNSITTDALESGKSKHLIKSYDVAKLYYLQQKNSIRPVKSIDKILFRTNWLINSILSFKFNKTR
jgi:glycosyltransferase involved in cell wall biosynthesis